MDDCDNIPGRWRATAGADLYAQAENTAPVVAHVSPGDWVNAVEKETLYRPYPSDDTGPQVDQGLQQVWRNGQRVTIETDPETLRIDWGAPATNAPQTITWVRVERANDTGGWLRDPGDFARMGEHTASEEAC